MQIAGQRPHRFGIVALDGVTDPLDEFRPDCAILVAEARGRSVTLWS